MKSKVFVISVLTMFLLAILAGGALATQKPKVPHILPLMGTDSLGKYVQPSPVMYEGRMQPDCEDINPDPDVTILQADIWGTTFYDYQKNGSMGRMIAVGPGGHVGATYHRTDGPFGVAFPRYVDYNCKDPVFGWIGAQPIDGGTNINAGYANIDVLDDGRCVVIYHTTAEIPMAASVLKVQDAICVADFSYRYDLPDYTAGGEEPGMWPKCGIVYDALVDTEYIHIVQTEGKTWGGNLRLGYLRCRLLPNDHLLCDTPDNGQQGVVTTPIDIPPNTPGCGQLCPIGYFGECEAPGVPPGEYPNTVSAVVATSPVSRKVAIVFTNKRVAGECQVDNDVFYFESVNNGDDWFPQYPPGIWPPTIADGNLHNITNYPPGAGPRAYTDVAACYDYDDNLHIVWNAHLYFPAQDWVSNVADFYHWSLATGTTIIANGAHEDEDFIEPGAWNRSICKMSISAKDPIYHPGEPPYLFCTWTQFDLGDMALNGYSNGDIHASVSNDAGATWTPSYNLTGTQTPDCAPGECLSEHWSSLAENMYDGDLHIEHVCDRDAGGVVQDEGVWTDNDMMYLHVQQLPWREGFGVDIELVEPDDWCHPPLKVVPGEERTITMELTGLYTLGGGYEVTTDNLNVVCTYNCAGFLAPQEKIEVGLTIYCQEESFMSVQVYVHSGIGTVDEKVDTIILHVVQSEDYYECSRDTLRTTIWKDNCKLKAWFCVNCEERVWVKKIYPEEKQQVIFSASPIVATSWQGDTVVGRQDFRDIRTGARDTIHHVVGQDPDQPECALQVVWSKNTFICANNLPPPNHQRWWWIDIHKQIFMWHDTLGMECPNWKKEQIIKQIRITKSQPPLWWPAQGVGTQEYEDIYFGFFADVDAPDDSCWGANFAGYELDREMIWHCGLGPPPQFDDYYVGHAFTDRNGGVVTPFGCQDVLNRQYLWPNGGWGWKEGELYQLAATPGVNIQNPGAADDRTVVLTADMIPGGTANFSSEFILIEAFIEGDPGMGLQQLRAHIDDTRDILIPHLHNLGLFDQFPICGDVNEDGKIDAADIVFLINYLFVPGSPPPSWPITRGDVNNDGGVDSADIVYLINYLFVPGTPPPECPGFGRE